MQTAGGVVGGKELEAAKAFERAMSNKPIEDQLAVSLISKIRCLLASSTSLLSRGPLFDGPKSSNSFSSCMYTRYPVTFF